MQSKEKEALRRMVKGLHECSIVMNMFASTENLGLERANNNTDTYRYRTLQYRLQVKSGTHDDSCGWFVVLSSGNT